MSEPVEICDPASPQDALNKILYLAKCGHRQILEGALLASPALLLKTVDQIEEAASDLRFEAARFSQPGRSMSEAFERLNSGIDLLKGQINGRKTQR